MGTSITTAVSTAISGTASSVVGLVTDNLPVILGVTVAFVGLSVAKKFVRGLAS